MRFFYFIAKKISYTFSLAFLTILGGWMAAVFSYFLGTSFILSSYDMIIDIFLKWLPWAVLVPTVLHYLHFGLLNPIKIPAFTKPLRHINKNFYGSRLNADIDDADLKSLYKYLSDLPLYNTITAAFGAFIASISLIGFIYFDFIVTSKIGMIDIKMGAIQVLVVIIN